MIKHELSDLAMCPCSQNCNDVPKFTKLQRFHYVIVWIQRFLLNLSCVFSPPLFFFFYFHAFQGGRRQILLFMRQISMFMHCFDTVYALFMRPTVTLLKKYIQNEFYGIIYLFKNYFITVFSVFNFQFTAIISLIQIDPISTR